MTWATKMNCALRSRNRIDRATMTTTRLSTLRIGWRKVITPMPPATARAAAMKKTAIAKFRWSLPHAWGSTRRSRGMGRCSLQPRLNVRRERLEQLLLGVDELLATRVRQLVLGAQHDRLHGARILAVAAEDAPQHVDLVGLGVALAWRDAVLVGVLRGDDQDAANRARRGAQLAADAALEPVLIAPQVVPTAVALGPRRLLLRVHGRDHRREEFAQGRLQPGGQRAYVGGNARSLALRVRGDALVGSPQGRRVVRPTRRFISLLLFVCPQLPLRRHQDHPGDDHVDDRQREQHLPAQAHEHVVTKPGKRAAQPNV